MGVRDAAKVLATGSNPISPARLVNEALIAEESGAVVNASVVSRRAFFAPDHVLPKRLPGETEVNDTTLLRQIHRSALNLDVERFESTCGQLLDDLERRVAEFPSEEFTLERFQGWCGSLSNLAGSFHFANRFFLYKTGEFVDDPDLLARIHEQMHAALQECDDRLGASITDTRTWCLSSQHETQESRRRLAMTVSYLMREAVVIDPHRLVAGAVEAWTDRAFDILVLSAGFAGVKFTAATDDYLVRAEDAVREALQFFTPDGGFRELIRRPYREEPGVKLAYLAAARAAGHLGLDQDVAKGLAELGLSSDDIASDTALGADRLKYTEARRPATHATDDAFAELRRADKAHPVGNLGSRLARCDALLRLGATSDARAVFPLPGIVPSLNLGQIYVYMRLAPLLYDEATLAEALYALRLQMQVLGRRHLGNVNFLARAIQYDTLVDDHFSAEQARLALARTDVRPPDDAPDEIVLLFFDQDRVGPGLLSPLMSGMSARGVAFYSLQEAGYGEQFVPLWPHGPVLTANANSLVDAAVHPDQLLNEWEIDLDDRVLRCNGANYFQGMYERVGRVLKVFHVDWSLASAQLYFTMWLRQIDRLVFCLQAAAGAAREHGQQIRLVSLQGHFVPYFALKVFAEHNDDVMQHVTMSSSYENWKSNMGGDPLGTFTLLNNTARPGPSMPAFGTDVNFESWFEAEFLPNRERYVEMSSELTGIRRAGVSDPVALAAVKDMAERGQHVFCALGKIPYDLTVPSQGGPAHSDMSDWIRHTVETVNESANSVLIVKPHPHELNYEISGKPIEGFVDLIPEINPERVMVLPHRGVSLQDLRGVVDTFVCWNGSSVTEVGSWGERMVACDSWAPRNYPVHIAQPSDREHYEQFLRAETRIEMNADFEERCIAYNCYLTEAPFAADYPYVIRSSNNTNFNQASIDFEALAVGDIDTVGRWAYEVFFPRPGADGLRGPR